MNESAPLSESLSVLVNALAQMDEIRAIGFTGDLQNLSAPGQGDLDIFLYCTAIPGIDRRRAVLDSMGKRVSDVILEQFSGGRWGHADHFLLDGVDAWLMYFMIDDARREVESILAGQELDRVDDFYPTGRLAMFRKMTALYDPDGILASFREQVRDYPPELRRKILDFHLAQLEDSEDLERGAMREDLLFYHFALDRAFDHYLQALFALNRTYFPSRKRSLGYIRSFARKPGHLESRLVDIFGWSVNPDTLTLANDAWEKLVEELFQLYSSIA